MEGETGRGKRNENHHVIHDVQVVGATNMAAFRSQYPYESTCEAHLKPSSLWEWTNVTKNNHCVIFLFFSVYFS